MDDGIYYDPDLQPITLSAFAEEPYSADQEEGFDYFDPQDVQSLPPMAGNTSPWSWGMGSGGFYDPFYSPMCDPYWGMGMQPGWNWNMGYSSWSGWQFGLGYGMGWGMSPHMGWGMNPYWNMNPYWAMNAYGPYNPYNPWMWGMPFEWNQRSGWQIERVRPSRTAVRGGNGINRPINGKSDVYATPRQINSRQNTTTVRTRPQATANWPATTESDRSQAGTQQRRQVVRREIQRELDRNGTSSPSTRPATQRQEVEYVNRAEQQSYHGRPAVRTRDSQSRSSNGWEEIYRNLERGSSRERSYDSESGRRPSRSDSEYSSPSRPSRSSSPSGGGGRTGGGTSTRSSGRSR